MNKTSRIATLGLTAAMVLAPVVIAQASDRRGPPDHVLQAAREAVTISRVLALEFAALAASGSGGTGVPEHAQGKPGHATGLARAREAIGLAAGRGNGNGNGHAFGRGHAAEVHAQLLAGGSPSDLPNHGAKVRALVAAFNSLKADSEP